MHVKSRTGKASPTQLWLMNLEIYYLGASELQAHGSLIEFCNVNFDTRLHFEAGDHWTAQKWNAVILIFSILARRIEVAQCSLTPDLLQSCWLPALARMHFTIQKATGRICKTHKCVLATVRCGFSPRLATPTSWWVWSSPPLQGTI